MKKHFCLFLALIIILVIGINYTVETSRAKLESPDSIWTIKGDEKLLSNVKVNYEIYQGKDFYHWKLEDTSTSTKVSYEKKQMFSQDITAENRDDKNTIEAWGNDFSNIRYMQDQDQENSPEEKAIFEPYLDLLNGGKEAEFEPIKINDYFENYLIYVRLKNECDTVEEQVGYIQYPIGDEVIATPYFSKSNWTGESEEELYRGELIDITYDYRVYADQIGDKCYVVVSYGKEYDNTDKDFTDIYLVSENSQNLLAQPKLVKHFDQNLIIMDMGSIDGKTYYTVGGYGRGTVNVINQDSFEVLQSYEIVIPEPNPELDVYSRGYPRNRDTYERLWDAHKMIRFKDDKLYLLTLMDAIRTSSFYKQGLELLVFEENNDEPVVDAIICNDLFSLTEGTHIFDFADGTSAYNYSLELQ